MAGVFSAAWRGRALRQKGGPFLLEGLPFLLEGLEGLDRPGWRADLLGPPFPALIDRPPANSLSAHYADVICALCAPHDLSFRTAFARRCRAAVGVDSIT